jgi:hypothetical protein
MIELEILDSHKWQTGSSLNKIPKTRSSPVLCATKNQEVPQLALGFLVADPEHHQPPRDRGVTDRDVRRLAIHRILAEI